MKLFDNWNQLKRYKDRRGMNAISARVRSPRLVEAIAIGGENVRDVVRISAMRNARANQITVKVTSSMPPTGGEVEHGTETMPIALYETLTWFDLIERLAPALVRSRLDEEIARPKPATTEHAMTQADQDLLASDSMRQWF